MTVRIGTSELARKGVRYRALEDGMFELAGSVLIPAGRTIAANNFVELFTIGPNVDIFDIGLRNSGALEDTGSNTGSYDVVSVFTVDNTPDQTLATNIIAFRNGANNAFVRLEKGGTAPLTWVPKPNPAPAALYAPRAVPLPPGASQPNPPTGTTTIRLRFTTPGTVTTTSASARTVHFVVQCMISAVSVPTLRPYTYTDIRDANLVSSP